MALYLHVPCKRRWAMDSAYNFWTLIAGLMGTLFGGYAFCFGLVKFIEKLGRRFQARHIALPSLPTLRRAA
jgi:hypothetical protein